ncbi:hypothetical protein TSAR_009331 [Trichomalopsis sarcophagae]|uniref:HMG box domain-containing protein n=1 Tax=Trichomalopsis sarcophagae TaxID=543379 RepID=A0A232F4X0_9HYME|nr:hypothetical protein TSAR_009331 [Trichomalopsis sarcophagae]
MSIKPLSKETVKLINSGQVISSIYSAIKELVENSLDAQAQNIEVNLVDDGLSLIEVKDNGCGISRDDAQYMALHAHTSKISDFNDLDLLSTYGFRGEGLTSVCQVADVTISTKTEEDVTMLRYTLNHDGQVVDSELSHGLTGTTVQMRNLFKNMPVRRNILTNKKRMNQELKAIELLLKMFSICKPSVRFMLRVNGKTVFTKISCKTVTEAVRSVYGSQIFPKLTHITKSFGQTEMQLFIPDKNVKDASEVSQIGLQFVCVNGRPIKSKEIEKKINKRISEYLNQNTSSSRKFVFCLILKVDPSMLDVNLEPNKDKIYLQNETAVLSEIDNSLLSFYELQDSQMSTQQSDIENVNCNFNIINESDKINQVEKEWPACKKRKLNLKDENIHDTSTSNKSSPVKRKSMDNTRKQSDASFLQSINGPALSDSDSNDADAEHFDKRILKPKDKAPEMMDIAELDNEDNIENNSELFDLAPNPITNHQVVEETLSQLPKVDLGEDFDWEEIVNKSNKSNGVKTESSEVILDKITVTDVAWSKGQVPGLQGGVAIGFDDEQNSVKNNRDFRESPIVQSEDSESFDFRKDVKTINDSEELIDDSNVSIPDNAEFEWNVNVKNTKKKTPSKKNSEKPSGTSKQVKRSLASSDDPTQTKIVFAGDNAGLINTGLSAFAMYCAEARTKILKEHPELTPAEVAVYMNQQWKEISPEERQYYRDLANKQNQSENNTSLSQAPKKSKPKLSQAEADKNRKQLVSMLESMKVNKTEAKKENIIMKTFALWDMSTSIVKERYQMPEVTEVERFIVGPLNSKIWIVNIKSKLFVFDVTILHDGLNIKDYDISQINAGYINDLVDKWITEQSNMNVFHQLYSMEKC